MKLPQSIQIQTIDYCNRSCVWCPNSKRVKTPSSLMDMTILNKLLVDLRNAGYEGAIHLYLMGEPLCDNRIEDCIKLTRSILKPNTIFISTNGDLLNDESDIKRLFDAGLTWMGVSHYDDKNKHLLQYKDKYPEMVHTGISQLRHTFYNRAGHVNVGCISPLKMCNWVFQKAYVNYKGDVILCCSDYDYQVVFGNVLDNYFPNIYQSAKYEHYRDMHRVGRGKELPLCDKCNRII